MLIYLASSNISALMNKRKLAAINSDNPENHPRNNQARNTTSPRVQGDYISQVSEETEGRVTKKLSQEFSRTEDRILSALSRLDEFLLNPQARVHSGPIPRTSGKSNREDRGTNDCLSQKDPHSEMGASLRQFSHELGPEETSHKTHSSFWVFSFIVNYFWCRYNFC